MVFASTPTKGRHGKMMTALKNLWYKLTGKKPDRASESKYRVCKKKKTDGCCYYVAQIMTERGWHDCLTYGTDTSYKNGVRYVFLDKKHSSGKTVRFNCPEMAELVVKEHIKKQENLEFCQVVKEGKINADSQTSDC
jgi:hypothetical protein